MIVTSVVSAAFAASAERSMAESTANVAVAQSDTTMQQLTAEMTLAGVIL